jgi:dCTP deaminase
VTFLSDTDIIALIESGDLAIDPLDLSAVGPCSIDLRLSDEFIRYTPQCIEVGRSVPDSENLKIDESGYLLGPGEFILGMTKESVRIPNGYHGVIETKGDLARAGVQVHANDSHIDAGTNGHITLEIKNLHNDQVTIRLFQGIYICQLFLMRLSSPAMKPYSGKYARQQHPTTYLP